MHISVPLLEPGALPFPERTISPNKKHGFGYSEVLSKSPLTGFRVPQQRSGVNPPQPNGLNRPFRICIRPGSGRPGPRDGQGRGLAARSPHSFHPAPSRGRHPGLGGPPHPQEAADAGHPETQREAQPARGASRGARSCPPGPALTGVEALCSPCPPSPISPARAGPQPRAGLRGDPPGEPSPPARGRPGAARGLKVTAGRPGRGSPRSPFERRPGAGTGRGRRRRGREPRCRPTGGPARGDASARGAGVRGTWCLGARVELLSGRGHAPAPAVTPRPAHRTPP